MLLEEERSIEDRMICALAVAHRFPRHEGVVSIHVGQEGWDWLMSLLTKEHTGEITPARAWGFPVVAEAAWPTAKIVVRSDQVIW